MIIRSQDKKSIFNLENIKSIKVGVLFTTWAGKSCDISIDNEVVGTYSTEEKAIKVLDMIQNVYIQYGTIKDGLGSIHGAFNIPKCFQMPSDEEVEV